MASPGTARTRLATVLALVFAIGLIGYSACWIHFVRQSASAWLGVEYRGRFSWNESVLSGVVPGSPAERAGLRAGDRIVAVNGTRLGDRYTLWTTVQRGSPGDRVAFSVERDGRLIDVAAELGVPPQRQAPGTGPGSSTRQLTVQLMRIYPLPFVCVALFVLFQRVGDRHAWVLAVMFAGFVAGAPLLEIGARMPPALRNPLLAWNASFGLALPGVFAYFFATFPARSPIDRRVPWLKHVLLWPAVAAAIALGLALLIEPARSWLFGKASHGVEVAIPAPVRPALLGFLIVCYAFGLLSLVLNAFTGPPDARRRTRVMLWGTLAAIVPVTALQAYTGATGLEMDQLPFWVWASVVLSLLLLPVSFAYAVVKHRVMEIPVLLRRSARYLLVRHALLVFAILLAVASTVAFARVVPLLAERNGDARAMGPFAAVGGIAFGAALAVGASRLLRRGTERIDRAFFRGAYDSRRILPELAARCRTASAPGQLANEVRRALDEAFHPRALHVLLRGDAGKLEHTAGPGAGTTGIAGAAPAAGRAENRDGADARAAAGGGTAAADVPELRARFQRGPVSEVTGPLGGALAWLDALDPELVVGLEGRDEHLEGLLVLGARRSEEPYSGEDRALLASVASQAGIALENIRLAHQIVERAEAERRVGLELSIAKQVQARLLPQRTPHVETLDYAGACVQAREVGGDYFDFLQVAEGQLALVLADIAGKGISAALLMASLQAMLRTRASQASRDLAGMLREVNQAFYDSTATNNYATLFFGIFDERSRELAYANCGHLPPVLCRASGETVRLACTATVMGLFEPWSCETARVTLEPGDTLVVFTDGATDALDASGEEYGEERLLDLIARHAHLEANALLQAIVCEVQAFSGPAQFDDLTLLVAKVVAPHHP
jgi:sigma-B regulation protein RsbU (phosphoserine phosphatase)